MLFLGGNTGSQSHSSDIKDIIFSPHPLVLFSDYVEPAEKVFISVCKLNALGVSFSFAPGSVGYADGVGSRFRRWRSVRRTQVENKAYFCRFIPLRSPTT